MTIKIYEYTGYTNLNETQAGEYITFCQSELEKEYPELDIEVLDEESIDKIVCGKNDFLTTDELEELEISVCRLWEKWDS